MAGKAEKEGAKAEDAELDAARQAYVLALRAAWVAHYRLRALTLYDFVRGKGL